MLLSPLFAHVPHFNCSNDFPLMRKCDIVCARCNLHLESNA
jgi:hypothetical protein